MTTKQKAAPERGSANYQRAVADMVSREVHYCVSSLIATLAKAGYNVPSDHATPELADLCEQAAELAAPIPDYEGAAYDKGWRHGGDNDGFIYDGQRFDSWKEAASADDARTYESWQACCEGEDIEPYERDVYEHWIVSDWLAARLEARGEKIDRDFAGLTVWARTTTGQMISMDGVICSIYDEVMAA